MSGASPLSVGEITNPCAARLPVVLSALSQEEAVVEVSASPCCGFTEFRKRPPSELGSGPIDDAVPGFTDKAASKSWEAELLGGVAAAWLTLIVNVFELDRLV